MRPVFNTLSENYPAVTRILDATRPLVVTVTPRDCRKASRKNILGCALAFALKREHRVDAALVNLTTAYIIKGHTATRFFLPVSISREIVAFDRTKAKAFQPGEYRLGRVPPSLRLAALRAYGRAHLRSRAERNRSKTRRARTTTSYRHKTTGVRVGAVRAA